MTTKINNKSYWEDKYVNNATGWDLGQVSPPLKAYIDQLENKDLNILIPGAGNSYEAEYLFQQGFLNTNVLDIAQSPLKNLKRRSPNFPDNQLIHDNFFDHEATYDIIFEQTFFCALPPELRAEYVNKIHDLLKPEGKLVGLLFTFQLTENGPPFGGSQAEYIRLFKEKFDLDILQESYNSYPKRQGNELFIKFSKRP